MTDASGAVIPAATVTIVGDQTKLTRTLQTTETGSYDFVNLPIGNYTIAVTHAGLSNSEYSVDSGAGEPHRHRQRAL